MLLPRDLVAALALVALVGASAWIVLSRATPKALGFAVLTTAAFLLQAADAFFLGGGYGRELAFTTPAFLAGEWWRAFSYMFVHASPFHAFGNLFLLATAGPLLEDRIGGRRWSSLYLGGGALAIGSHMIIFPTQDVAAVGASGAIFAVLGALAVVAPQARVPIPVFFVLWFPAWVAVLIFFGFNVAYALSGTGGVAWYGHFAGLAIGIAFAAWAVRRPGVVRGARPARLPEAAALEPLATTPRLRRYLERLRALTGGTPDDAAFAAAWVERFVAEAACPRCGKVGLRLEGSEVRCPHCGERATSG